jgi:hypothetical protein
MAEEEEDEDVQLVGFTFDDPTSTLPDEVVFVPMPDADEPHIVLQGAMTDEGEAGKEITKWLISDITEIDFEESTDEEFQVW